MNIVGIVSEFNPFHSGHQYLISKVREELQPDGIVCVMSGNFVQRGEPALCGKFARAKMAINGGADLVLELPTVYALNSASEFAKGAVRVLSGLGNISTLAFGSESGDEKSLLKAAQTLACESSEFAESLKKYSGQGISYAEAYAKAAVESGVDKTVFEGSNDILALEYLKQNILQNAGMKPFAVKRKGADHDSKKAGEFASASYIRSVISDDVNNNNVTATSAKLKAYISPENLEILMGAKPLDKSSSDMLYQLVRYKIISSSAEEIGRTLEVSEGLENRIKQAVIDCGSLDDLIHQVKSKRYNYARISRILMQLLLGITKEEYAIIENNCPAFAKVLAFNEKGAAILKDAADKATVPVYSNVNAVPKDAIHRELLEFDLKASDIYSIIRDEKIYSGSDMTYIPKPEPKQFKNY